MKKFSILVLSILTLLFSACDNSKDKKQVRICPECNMELPDNNLHTCTMTKGNHIEYFDDIGCLILWTKDKNIDLNKVKSKVFSNDTKRYIDIFKAYYRYDERTPMLYGFSAYEHKKDKTIDFNEVRLRMLRGEHMANPKIRKQILGY